jgi:hydrogenase maturation factor
MTVVEAPSTTEHAAAEDLASAALSLARRFAAGATMWCIAPQWPAHGRHVAVHIEGLDTIAAVRLLARPGDVLLAVSAVDDPATAELLSRAEAWGMTRIWLGAGARPTSGRAEHVVWLDGADPTLASRSGDMVLLYHLLWELTHVVFEHRGLLEPEAECTDAVCVTCSDEGRVAEVRSVHSDGLVEVMVNGTYETIDASLVDRVEPGDLLLVHAGVALTTLEVLPQ